MAEERRNVPLVFAGYFWAPIPWMIEVALVLSLLVGHWADAAMVRVHGRRPGPAECSDHHVASFR